MKVEKVYSHIEANGKDLKTQPFWSKCYHADDLTSDMLEFSTPLMCYHVKFDGLTPVQLTKAEKVTKLPK